MSEKPDNYGKFKYAAAYTEKNYKKEFILSCLQLPKSMHKSIAWPKEVKMMNQLTAKITDPAFWYHARPTFQLPSVAWFLTDSGRKYLNEKWRSYNLSLTNPRDKTPAVDTIPQKK